MKAPIKHLPDEADIGSGEKSPGHRDTEKLIEQVGNSPAQKPSGGANTPENRTVGTTQGDGQSPDRQS
ncbi:MAG: hypothetical protein JWR21_3904 [Herminiimonas sp.]|nr:hypothetical protein [Herminiimonas sp.]MDB5852759.1 hypothetical protein [Herminiimonas sp.]